MAERTPNSRASYEAAHTAERFPRHATTTGLPRSRIEAHREERIEFRLECVRVDDLVIALPIVDLSLGERVDHHQVKRLLILRYLSVIVRMLDRKEVFIKRNVQFRGKDLLRVKGVVVPKLL